MARQGKRMFLHITREKKHHQKKETARLQDMRINGYSIQAKRITGHQDVITGWTGAIFLT
jgi:hypothetical protein